MGLVLLASLLLTVSVAGCLDPFRPLVDQEIFQAGQNEHLWTIEKSPQVDNGLFGPNVVETEYRHDPANNQPQYPGLLLLVGIRSSTAISTTDLLERTREILSASLTDEGVRQSGNEKSGTRTLASGAVTQWFSIVGTADSDSGLFAGEEEVRILGEAWFDGRSKTNVVAVALAQTTISDILGGETRDDSVWNQLVGDPAGSIDGAQHESGFIYNVRSHN